MKKLVIIGIYFIIFWILLPVGLLLASSLLDRILFPGISLTREWMTAGYFIFVPGLLLMILSVLQFRYFGGEFPVSSYPPKKIVDRGLFAVWRHPIYLFASVTVIGMALLSRSYAFLVIVLPVFILAVILYINNEETVLGIRFGDAYRRHRNRVPLLVPRLHKWLKLMAYPFFSLRFRIKITGRENLQIAPPFFVVAAHRNYLDPFFIAYALPWPVRYITTYEMFRNPALARIFNRLGSIPKKRYAKDMQSIRTMIRALEEGHPVGVFPEGGRSWTGEVRSLKEETLAMFMKFKHIPLLPVRLEGNFHSWPRWSPRMLRADLTMYIEDPFYIDDAWTQDDLKQELLKKISPREDAEWKYRCKSKVRNGHLSTVLYRCPYCDTMNGLREKGKDSLACKECGRIIQIDEYFDLHLLQENGTEKSGISEMYKRIKFSSSDVELLDADESVLFSTGVELSEEQGRRFFVQGRGILAISGTGMEYTGEDGEHIFLPFRDLGAVTIESYYKLQLYMPAREKLYQFTMSEDSVLKWQDAILLLMEKKGFTLPVSR